MSNLTIYRHDEPAQAIFQSADFKAIQTELNKAGVLFEHTHSEDEVRFFVKGQGLFCLHLNERVYQVLCQQGDLISVPANTQHWFDMGSDPEFTAIRFFNNEAGWVAQSTNSDIATQFPILD